MIPPIGVHWQAYRTGKVSRRFAFGYGAFAFG
jgi:hypothetical protein